jgi:hypothetical protein
VGLGLFADFGFSGKSSSVSGLHKEGCIFPDIVHTPVNAPGLHLMRIIGAQEIDGRVGLIGGFQPSLIILALAKGSSSFIANIQGSLVFGSIRFHWIKESTGTRHRLCRKAERHILLSSNDSALALWCPD